MNINYTIALDLKKKNQEQVFQIDETWSLYLYTYI